MAGMFGNGSEAAGAALRGIRALIDGVDDGFVLLFAGRRRLVLAAARVKRGTPFAGRDPGREREVRERARRLGERLGLPPDSCEQLVAMLIDDALRHQRCREAHAECGAADLDQGAATARGRMLAPDMTTHARIPTRNSWLRWLPPPPRWRPVLARVPSSWHAASLESAARKALAPALAEGRLDMIEGRRIGIAVEDLGLRWVVRVRGRQLEVCGPDELPEATVCGSATDLLLLASRREDADTLFFQRRLRVTGDVELGLTARNLLDQLPWEEVPLGLRILMHRGAGLLQDARAAYRHGRGAD